MPHLSIVAPVFREEGNVSEFCRQVIAAAGRITPDFEVILVEDGGGDNSWSVIREEARKDPRVKGLKFSRNFGQHCAISAGLDAARGDWTVVMDSDLQDRPEVIPELYAKAQEGFDVVFVAREERPESWSYQLAQRVFYRIFRYLAGTDYDPQHGNFSIISKSVLESYQTLHESMRFYGGLLAWLGYSRASIPARHGRRYAGQSVYSLAKRIRFAAAIIVAHSDRPLRFSIVVGLAMAALSFLYGLYIVCQAVFGGVAVQGWASLIVSIYLVGGMILAVLGVMGLYIGKMYHETKRRPLYVVSEKVGFQELPASLRKAS